MEIKATTKVGRLWEKFTATYPEMVYLWRQFVADSKLPNSGLVYRLLFPDGRHPDFAQNLTPILQRVVKKVIQ
jgi:hypothetical protein